MENDKFQNSCFSLEDNLKKAVTELLILHLLDQRDYYIGELTETLNQQSHGVLKLVFPYSAVYRLLEDGYIMDSSKRIAPDGRKRQYYRISPQGHQYYGCLKNTYHHFIEGVDTILDTDLQH